MTEKAGSKPARLAGKAAWSVALDATRRRVVLDGAWRVFARNGLEGATMRAIAAEAGCTTGAVYPIFPSKEVIYAALLAESLDRLHDAVAMAIGEVEAAPARAEAAARAFLTYYRDRPDEVALGLYLWHGLRPRGLTPDLNAEMNARLTRTLDLLRQALSALGGLDPAAARLETGALFAFLIGALVVDQTGRTRLLGSDLDAMARVHIDALVARLSAARGQ